MVACGKYHSAAIKTDGTLWAWGMGGFGALGTTGQTNAYTPVQTASGGTNWKMVAAGHYNTCGIKTDGTLWGWGYNSSGQLGLGDRTTRNTPVQLNASTNWKMVAVGGYSCIASIKTDGTLWTCGQNYYGVLGDGTDVFKSSPVQTAAGGTNWKMVSVGWYCNMAAIKTDGTLWTWGRAYGNGDGTTTTTSSPVQIYGGGTNWKHISVGNSHSGGIIDIS